MLRDGKPTTRAKKQNPELLHSSTDPPKLAWQRPLASHANPVKEFSVTFFEAIKMAKLGMRMWSYVKEEKAQGRVPPIDPFGRETKPLACHGVPLGGMGGGSIGRGFRGEFRRWQFIPGVCEEAPVWADQFSVFVVRGKGGTSEKRSSAVLYPGRPSELKGKEGHWGVGSWDWNLEGSKSTYHALFPRAWTVYQGEPDPELTICCRQVSPFIPHNYRESSFPCSAFVYTLVNSGREAAEVCLSFTFANSIGGESMLQGGHHNSTFTEADGVKGVLLHHRSARVGAPVTFAVAAQQSAGVEVSLCPRFSVTGQGGGFTARDMWEELKQHGRFVSQPSQAAGGEAVATGGGAAAAAAALSASSSSSPSTSTSTSPPPDSAPSSTASAPSYAGTAIGAAVAATVRVAAGQSAQVVFSLAWDSPIVKFSNRSSYYRRYTQFFSQHGDCAASLAHTAITDFPEWDAAIQSWQQPIITDESLPPWYRSTLFNELYYLVAGGTIWTDGGPRLEERRSSEWSRSLSSPNLEAQAAAAEEEGEGEGEGVAEGEAHSEADRGEVRTGKRIQRVASEGSGLNGGSGSPSASLSPSPSPSPSPSFSPSGRQRVRDKVRRKGKDRGKGRAGKKKGRKQQQQEEERQRQHNTQPLWKSCSGVRLLGEKEDNVGQFLYLEGLEYVMWNTYDVHFYASFALLSLFPLLELAIQRDFAAGTLRQQSVRVRYLMDNGSGPRKVAGSVPHDLGNSDPWIELNAYNIHDTSRWKDLNAKFVLQVYRDCVATSNMEFAAAMWPAVVCAMEYACQFDRDGDGLIENDGFADQTYDTWEVHGVSAYCGGLWLAAVQAMAAYAALLGDTPTQHKYSAMLDKGKVAMEEKLWNGRYFKYDSGSASNSDSIQADQMAGQWYSWSCGLPPLFPSAMARSALQTVFQFNVMQNGHGNMGAVNGMHPNGQVDDTCMQSREIWTGVTYAAGAAMLYEGLVTEGFKTAEGIYKAGWEEHGYWFQSPEAWTTNGRFRSLSYMRPLAIWGMQWAIQPPKHMPAAPMKGQPPKPDDSPFSKLVNIASLVPNALKRQTSKSYKFIDVLTCGL